MSDITMCSNKECKLSVTCYRFNANKNPYRQPYFLEPKKDCEDKGYEYYKK